MWLELWPEQRSFSLFHSTQRVHCPSSRSKISCEAPCPCSDKSNQFQWHEREQYKIWQVVINLWLTSLLAYTLSMCKIYRYIFYKYIFLKWKENKNLRLVDTAVIEYQVHTGKLLSCLLWLQIQLNYALVTYEESKKHYISTLVFQQSSYLSTVHN